MSSFLNISDQGDMEVAGTVKANGFLLPDGSPATSKWTEGGNGIFYDGNVGIRAELSFSNMNHTEEATGITWYGPEPLVYGIHRTAGPWDAPDFQQLRLGWATGIILDPGTDYGKSYVDIQGNGLRVTSGKVGIGTAEPDAELDVVGAIRAVRSDGLNNHYFTGMADNGDVVYDLRSTGGAANSAQMFLRSYNAETIRFDAHLGNHSFFNAGNVGIGTTEPGTAYNGAVGKLVVDPGGTDNLQPGLLISNTTNRDVGMSLVNQADGGRHWQILSTGGNSGSGQGRLSFYDLTTGTNEGIRMVIDSGGKVGIGTPRPEAQLHVLGGSRSFPPLVTQCPESDGYSTIRHVYDQGEDWNVGVGNSGAAPVAGSYYIHNGEFRVVVKSNGNVGIGTTDPDPDAKLDVNGTIKATGLDLGGGQFILPENPTPGQAPPPPENPKQAYGQVYWDNANIWIYTRQDQWESARIG